MEPIVPLECGDAWLVRYVPASLRNLLLPSEQYSLQYFKPSSLYSLNAWESHNLYYVPNIGVIKSTMGMQHAWGNTGNVYNILNSDVDNRIILKLITEK
jgi:hypothetical protein